MYNPEKLNKSNRFVIYGLDIIFDSKYNPYLIECNSKPDLSGPISSIKKFRYKVVDVLMNYAMNLDSEHINKDFYYNYC